MTPRMWLGRLAVPCAALGALAACAPAARDSPPRRTVDLVALFDHAELRADHLDLPLLLSRELLGRQGWVEEDATPPRTVLETRRTTAALEVPFFSTGQKELRLTARCGPGLGPRIKTVVSLNDRPVAALDLGPDLREFRIELPGGLQLEGTNQIGFEALAASPRQRHAVTVTGLETARSPAQGRTSPPRRDGRRVWLPAGSSLSYYLRQRPDSEIQLLVRGTPGGTARLVARTQREAEAPQEVGRVEPASGDALRLQFAPGLPEGAIFRLELASVGSVGAWIDQAILSDPGLPRLPGRSLPGRPNLVVFLVDALRADHLGAYGHPAPTSPRFDAFAREALLFEDAVAQSSWTRPAVASLFTGLGVDAHGVGGMTNTLVPELTTLAEAFRAVGYRTGGFVANHIVSERLGFAQGFDTWDRKGPLLAAGLVPRILSWIDGAETPFFLYVHTVDLHGPYTPEPRHWAPFLFEGYRGNRNTMGLALRLDLGPQELRFLRSAYEGEVRQGDAAFGALLDGLGRRGLLDRSILVFTADHGEEFREHGGGGHGNTLYREVLRIPLAVRLPHGERGGLRVGAPVQQIDLLPSLLALVGAPAVPGLEGRDLSARWLGAPTAGEEPPVLLSRLRYGGADKVAARLGQTKLILNQERNRTAGPRLELYDLASDPEERDNLAEKRPIIARYLWTQASALRAAEAVFRERHGSGREVKLSPEEIEQIRAMGYIQ